VTARSRKQLTILGVLVAVLVVTMFVVSRGEGPAGSTPAPSNRSGAQTGAARAPQQVADVRLELLKAERDALSEPERNLFVFKPKAPPPPPPRAVIEPPPRPVEIAPPVPTGPPPPPPIPLKFIGVLERPGQQGKVAILSDGRGGTFYAAEGESVLGQYKVLKIGAESAELSYTDGRGRQTLRLSGQ
jgi:hypothetical protein